VRSKHAGEARPHAIKCRKPFGRSGPVMKSLFLFIPARFHAKLVTMTMVHIRDMRMLMINHRMRVLM